MATSKKAAKKTTAKKSAPAADKPKAASTKNATSAHVYSGDEHIRTYSKEEHGDSFAELANEFASKDGDRKVVLE